MTLLGPASALVKQIAGTMKLELAQNGEVAAVQSDYSIIHAWMLQAELMIKY
jgi:hypothetical protein